MTRYLLDTNIALLGLEAPERIPEAVRQAVQGAPVYLSVLTYWEVLIKTMKGKLDVGDPRAWWEEALQALTAIPLALRPDHVARVYTLPPIHKDPFDRALIAQATVEDLTLVTTDNVISQYANERFRVLS